jgi:hypothetical protein
MFVPIVGVAFSSKPAITKTVAMPLSMRVVNTAAHFGACLAEELNPGASNVTNPGYDHACIGSLTSESLGNSCPMMPSAASYRLAASVGRSAIQHECLSTRRQSARLARHTETSIHDGSGNAILHRSANVPTEQVVRAFDGAAFSMTQRKQR